MYPIKSIIFFLLLSNLSFGQQSFSANKSFDWGIEEFNLNYQDQGAKIRATYSGAHMDESNAVIPIHTFRFPVSSDGKLFISVESIDFLDTTFQLSPVVLEHMKDELVFHSDILQEKNNYIGFVSFNPIYKENSTVKYIKNIRVKVKYQKGNNLVTKNPPKTKSVLSEGDFYKYQITTTGLHSLTGADLESNLGINLSDININQIQIFGNEGGKVQASNALPRTDDLEEIPLFIQDNNNVFDGSDKIIFFVHGATRYDYNPQTDYFDFVNNPFHEKNYIFIRLNQENGKRVQKNQTYQSDISTTNQFLDILRFEEEKYNLLEENFGNHGSGQDWFGDIFSNGITSREYTDKINLSQATQGSSVRMDVAVAGRSSTSSNYNFYIGNQEFSKSISSVSINSQEGRYANYSNIVDAITIDEVNPKIELSFNISNSTSKGWLDYIEFQYPRELKVPTGQSLLVRTQVPDQQNRNFRVSGSSTLRLWNVSDIHQVNEHVSSSPGTGIEFTISDNGGATYVLFDDNNDFLKPVFVNKLENQNLHAIQSADMLIISHPSLLNQAERLADFRREFNDFDVKVVDIQQIYHEFSSGRCDPSGVRDFIKMVYDRDPELTYVLLFGSGSFDYKGIKYDRDINNLVPVYETPRSLHTIESFPSDDFYVLLSEQEGGNLKGQLDLAIGRIPVRTLTDAATVIDKIIKYETSPEMRGDWNLRSVFAADDEDSNTHLRQSEDIAVRTDERQPIFNQEKLFFDAFVQESTPGGERYPEVTAEISNKVYKGALTLCYLGHGGPSGWAQERVLQYEDILEWNNERSMPLVITATCSFATYDDPSGVSAGERVLVDNNGGIALFTTSRAVYAHHNKRLTSAVFDTLYSKVDGDYLGIGETLRRAKNTHSDDTTNTNARKFSLLGDPAVKLLNPSFDVNTSHINGQDINLAPLSDTIKALSKMSIGGYISNSGVLMEDFQGIVSVTVFDKEITSKTLGQDAGSSVRSFKERKNIIFKGKAQVTDGKFELEFTVPKDILFYYGNGKISYYATDGKTDAKGEFRDFIVGGSDETASDDDTPPIVQVYMNNEDFVSGGITNTEPVLYAVISDDIGINLSGTGVGHDLTAVIDEDAKQTYILNDFYEGKVNDFKNGSVKYPLSKLANGQHKIKVKAWDLSNNVGEGYVEFVVSDDPGESLTHVLNYPNPFTTSTCFQFEHNIGNDMLDVRVDIYSMSGKLVKSIVQSTASDGFRVNNIKWDGKDDFGSNIGKGVYLYKISVLGQQTGISKASEFERLVILK